MLIKEIKEKQDIRQAAELAELCFHDWSVEDTEKFFNTIKDFYLIGAFEEELLLAAAGFHKFQIYIRDHLYNCSGIASVMTHPIQRRKGYVKILMEKLLTKSYKDGYEVSVLWPFNHEFYRKFGYGIADKPVQYKIKPSNLKKLQVDEKIQIREIKEEEEYPTFNKIAKNALFKNTRIIGEFDAWYLRRTQKFKIYIFEKENQPVGYISFKFDKPKDKEWSNYIQVVDWAYDTIETKKAIISFLHKFESDIHEIRMALPYEEELLSYLKEFNTLHSIANWPAMIRIINIKKLMEGVEFPEELITTLYAKITDEFIPENDGLWRFNIEEGRCSAIKIQENLLENKTLELSIDQLSQIVIGSTNVKTLTEIRNELIPEEWLNEQLFPTVPCWFGVWF